MLRIGKSPKDTAEQESPAEKHDVSNYSAPRTFSSYQTPAAPEVKPPAEATSTAPRALTESESLAREIKEGNLSGFVGGGTLVTGEANFKALMRVDGHLSGRITSSSGTLIVGANGKVDANIEVAIAVIHGTVNGDIIATQRLELGRAAKLNGNIQTPSLVIEQGALFEGSCKMIKMNAGASKQKVEAREAQPLDTSSMKSIAADSSAEQSKIANVSSVAS
ncbi:MAG TPA: polymer-forming cytoskeletal protein [Pyrinomonadaceae bacterium]|jgi:cytoskeletal protein CcmA (bactofilin family)|nr:polymer-forming cytoskeletal protein [Pyrinomonadaceae bacterium]